MTDGCGFANLATLHSIKEVLELDNIPTAVQCRIAGAKVCFFFFWHPCIFLLQIHEGITTSPSRHSQELTLRA